MPAYSFQETNSILPADFHVIDWKFHPTRLLERRVNINFYTKTV